MTTTNYHCGNNLRYIRELFDYTQQYVAYKIGISDKTYRGIEKMPEPPSAYHLHALNKFYQLDLSLFIHLSKEDIIRKMIK